MRSNNSKSRLTRSGLAASVLLLAGGAAFAQQQINLTAGPTSLTLPDGSVVPMWGYTCDATQVAGSTATCAKLNPNAPAATATTPAGWSPVVITVPTGQDLTINLTNNLSLDRKSTRLNSSHMSMSYAVFCLNKKRCYSLYVCFKPSLEAASV